MPALRLNHGVVTNSSQATHKPHNHIPARGTDARQTEPGSTFFWHALLLPCRPAAAAMLAPPALQWKISGDSMSHEQGGVMIIAGHALLVLPLW